MPNSEDPAMTRMRPALLALAALAAAPLAHSQAVNLQGPAPTQGQQYEYRITGEPTERGRYIFDMGNNPIEGTIESEISSRVRYEINQVTGGTITGASITLVEYQKGTEYGFGGETTEETSGHELNGFKYTYTVEDGYWECDVDAPSPISSDFKEMLEYSGFYDPRLLYPAGQIRPDTTWTVEADALNGLPVGVTLPGATHQGGGEFRYVGVEQVEGQRIAVIQFGLDVAYEYETSMQGITTASSSRATYQGVIYRNLDTYLDTIVMEGVSYNSTRTTMATGVSTVTKIEPRRVRAEQSLGGNATRERRPGPVIVPGDDNNNPRTDPGDRRRPAPVPLNDPNADPEDPNPRSDPAPRRDGPRPAPVPRNTPDPQPENNPNPQPQNNPGPRPAPVPQNNPQPDNPGPRPAPVPG
jgi:hypothetical protein